MGGPSKIIPESASKLLHKVASDLNFVDYTIDTGSGSVHGDNIRGELIAICLNGVRLKDNQHLADSVRLFLKIAPENEERCRKMNIGAAFDREHFVYSQIFREFAEFQREKGLTDDEAFGSIPRVYASESDAATNCHVLIMEDLRAKNFNMWPKDRLIDIDHELLMMRELGKLHGVSFALKDQRPTVFEPFKCITEHLSVMMNTNMALFRELCAKIANAVERPEHKALVSVPRIRDILHKCFTAGISSRFNVITHDDLWITNFMFQYSEDGANDLKSLSIFDWQLARYCSPVQDLLFQIFSVTDKSFRDRHYQQLITAYYDSLSGMIRRLGSDPAKLFSFADLQHELRTYGEYALVVAPMIHQFRMATPADVSDYDAYTDALEKGDHAVMFKPFDADRQRVYDKLVNDIIADLIDYGYVKL